MLKIACENCCMSLNDVISTIPEIVNVVTMSPYTIRNLPMKFVIVPDILMIRFFFYLFNCKKFIFDFFVKSK